MSVPNIKSHSVGGWEAHRRDEGRTVVSESCVAARRLLYCFFSQGISPGTRWFFCCGGTFLALRAGRWLLEEPSFFWGMTLSVDSRYSNPPVVSWALRVLTQRSCATLPRTTRGELERRREHWHLDFPQGASDCSVRRSMHEIRRLGTIRLDGVRQGNRGHPAARMILLRLSAFPAPGLCHELRGYQICWRGFPVPAESNQDCRKSPCFSKDMGSPPGEVGTHQQVHAGFPQA